MGSNDVTDSVVSSISYTLPWDNLCCLVSSHGKPSICSLRSDRKPLLSLLQPTLKNLGFVHMVIRVRVSILY